MLSIRQCSVQEVMHQAATLADGYRVESGLEEFADGCVRFDLYRTLEDMGILGVFGAFVGDELVGFATVVVSIPAHLGFRIGVCESLYVVPEYRKTGAGKGLIDAAEAYAYGQEARGLFVTSLATGRLARALPHMGYRHTHVSYFKQLTRAPTKRIAPMSQGALARVANLERAIAAMPQALIPTSHTLHGGLYSRTVLVPAGVVITGALIKIATTLILSGNVRMFSGDDSVELTGYNVISAAAGRKSAFLAETDTHMTMIFATDAASVAEAEAQFTDQCDLLLSRRQSVEVLK